MSPPQQLDILALYQSDIGDKILSYADSQDLCTIDLLNKQFQQLTTEYWKNVTYDKFGMTNGKQGWILGTSFLREPVFIHPADDEDEDIGYGYHAGSPAVAANESFVISVTDDTDHYDGRPDENEIGIRDARTLNYIRTDRSSPISNWKVALCGRVGSEIVVTSNSDQICARRGNDLQMWQFSERNGNGIPMIGCKTHLIVACCSIIRVYVVHPVDAKETENAQLLSFGPEITMDSNGDVINHLSWGADKTEFIVGITNNNDKTNRICIYYFDATRDRISLAKRINTFDWQFNNVALANEHIVASSSEDRTLRIWERSICPNVIHDNLSDIDLDVDDEGEFLDAIVDGYPHRLSCHGHLLISTSRVGCALCVWDMKRGLLLRRYNHANNENHVDMLPLGSDVTDMVYLEHLNAYLMIEGFMNVWSFPTNSVQNKMSKAIRRREKMMTKMARRMSSMTYDDDDDDDDES